MLLNKEADRTLFTLTRPIVAFRGGDSENVLSAI